MLMKHWLKIIFLLPCLLWFSNPTLALPQGLDATLYPKIIYARDLILNRQYDQANTLFREFETKYPESPLGIFGQAAVLQSKMFENFDFRYDAEIKPLAEKLSVINEKLLKNNNATAWDLYLAGSSSGVMAFYYVRSDQLLKALGAAGDCKKALELSIKKDPNFFDPYFGLGMYQFWRSVYTSKFKLLPFFKDQRQDGIQKMKLAMEKGDIGKPLSMAGMIFVYWEYKDFNQGLQISQQLESLYPNSLIAKLLKGNMLIELFQYQAALDLFSALKQKFTNHYLALYFMAYCELKLKKSDLARAHFEEFLTHQPAPAWHAYTLYNLAFMDLGKGDSKAAYEKFKQGSKIYPEFKGNLKELLKLRSKN